MLSRLIKLGARFTARALPTLAVSLLAAVGCGEVELAEDDESSASGQESKIVGGVLDEDKHPSVGILRVWGNGQCTATLIKPDVVLTAAHCVVAAKKATFFVGYKGTDTGSESLDEHATAYNGRVVRDLLSNPLGIPLTPLFANHDFALVLLDQDVVGVTPSPLYLSPPQEGQPVTIVGYGSAGGSGDFGTRRVAQNTIHRVNRRSFQVKGNANACTGDSGGPVFIQRDGVELVAGVTSFGSGGCGDTTTFGRVDAASGWIERASKR